MSRRDATLAQLSKLNSTLRVHLESLPKKDLDDIMRALNMSGRGPRSTHIIRILNLITIHKVTRRQQP